MIRLSVSPDAESQQYDKDSDEINRAKLKKQGWKVLRVWEHEVLKNLPGVVDKIQKIIKE